MSNNNGKGSYCGSLCDSYERRIYDDQLQWPFEGDTIVDFVTGRQGTP